MNERERSLLGTRKGDRRYITLDEWKHLRPHLVSKMARLIRGLRPEMTAYTPGETLDLLRRGEVREWFRMMYDYCLPGDDPIVFVPCGKTKPWLNATRGVYKAYNEVMRQRPDLQFVTISEPLGVVPSAYWGTFPVYDCPGLFRGSRQIPMEPFEWYALGFKEIPLIPHDTQAADLAIRILGNEIGFFVKRQGLRAFAFVDSFGHQLSTHAKMCVAAEQQHRTIRISRYPRREAPRTCPGEYILKVMSAIVH